MSGIPGVYIMGNRNKTLYTGMSGDLTRRVFEHKKKLIKGFTYKYNLTDLFYFEFTEDTWQALVREKQIKNFNRKEKLELIEKVNPLYTDMYHELINQSG